MKLPTHFMQVSLRPRPLKAIAAWINQHTPALGLRARAESSKVSTDQQIAGTRFRRPGKGRRGVDLRVTDLRGNHALRHHSGETYRTNSEVEEWLAKRIANLPAEKRASLGTCPHCHLSLPKTHGFDSEKAAEMGEYNTLLDESIAVCKALGLDTESADYHLPTAAREMRERVERLEAEVARLRDMIPGAVVACDKCGVELAIYAEPGSTCQRCSW